MLLEEVLVRNVPLCSWTVRRRDEAGTEERGGGEGGEGEVKGERER